MKLNKKGFTLIELLAVITIMGILMMVAIPAVSRTIENSRRDTFGDVAINYVNVVRNAALADELKCWTADATTGAAAKFTGAGTGGKEYKKYAALKDGIYVFYLATDADAEASGITATAFGESGTLTPDLIVTSTLDLMESGGKSSWGGNDVYGYVAWMKSTDDATANITTTYSVLLRDVAGHGMPSEIKEEEMSRTAVISTLKVTDDNKEFLTKPITSTIHTLTKTDGTTTNAPSYVCTLDK